VGHSCQAPKVWRLLASIDDLHRLLDGICVHSENFQALRLLDAHYREQIKCAYIDPPYNTSSSSIPYKNNYRHSCWGTLMLDRLHLLRRTLRRDGVIFVSIDKLERTLLEQSLDAAFGAQNKVEELIWSMNTNNSQAPNYSTNHEYVEVYAADRKIAEQDRAMFREPKPGYEDVMELVAQLSPRYPAISEIEAALRRLYEEHRIKFQEEIEAQGLEWDDEKGSDPWKGLFSYSRAEYRDSSGRLVQESDARAQNARIWIWQEGDASMPATKQATTTRDPNHANWRFYNPLHPDTGRPSPHPKSGWKFAYADDENSPDKRSFIALNRDNRISWGADETKVPRLKRMLHEVETNVGKSVFQDYSDGEKQTSALFGRSGVFLAPKHSSFVGRFIQHGSKPGSTIIDCFGGSGSTAHAVIQLNREDRGNRKYVTVEVGHYFESVIIPRLMKVVYSSAWRNGKPITWNTGVSHAFKIVRLESYEDTLNNLRLARSEAQQTALGAAPPWQRSEYMLGYFLDVESAGSASLLDTNQFRDPFSYQLQISTRTAGETKPTNVDLIETFNWLLGLKVKHIDHQKGFVRVTGDTRSGDRTLVVWRTLGDDPIDDNKALEEYLTRIDVNPTDTEYAAVYVNGSHTLNDPHNKIHLTEEAFHRLMFENESFESLE
jgi:adenine-specific DNA-methyltransferase